MNEKQTEILRAILEETLVATDEWGGSKLAEWEYGNNIVIDGINETVEAIGKFIDIIIIEQDHEVKRLKQIIRCEMTDPPFVETDDQTTEFAVRLAEAEVDNRCLQERVMGLEGALKKCIHVMDGENLTQQTYIKEAKQALQHKEGKK